MVNAENWEKQWGQLVAKAWADEALKARLLENPEAVLEEHNLAIPPGTQVRVVENTDRLVYLSLPRKPSSEEISDEDLARVASGIVGNDSCSATYFPNKPPKSL